MDAGVKKSIIITGATGGIGKEIARALIPTGSNLILAVRNIAKGNEVASRLREFGGSDIEVRALDLADADSIKNFAGRIKRDNVCVHALVNNAGVLNRHFHRCKSGIESTMMVNVIGTALLTHLIAPLVRDGGHIVFTTSLTRRFHDAASISIDPDEAEFSQLATYGKSKAAITHYALYLCNLYPRLRVNCADPGVVNSDMITMDRWYDPVASLIFRPFIRTPRQGAMAALHALAMTESGNIAYAHSHAPIAYNPYSRDHASLVEAIRARVGELL